MIALGILVALALAFTGHTTAAACILVGCVALGFFLLGRSGA